MRTPRRFLPSIASLRALEALDRLGSASAVARELNLTQGAVSRQLQALERQMGTALVLRDRKRLSLTPAAQAYAGEIRQALNRIAQASVRLQVAPATATLNLAILPTFGMRWLMPRLPEFARLHPEISINMTTRLVPFNFQSEPFDAAIHFGDGDWPGTARLLLRHEVVVAVCAPGLVDAGPPRVAADLLQLPLLHIQTRPRAWQDWFDRQGAPVRGPLPGTVHDQFSTIIQAALHGLGVALLPDYLVETDLATGRLVTAFAGPVEASGAYYLVWPETRTDDPALARFRGWLATAAEPEDRLSR